MSTAHLFGEAGARRLDLQYAIPVMVEQRRRILEALALEPGERALDIGCGPGYLAYEMAREVGPQGRVLAIDTSDSMLEVARGRCREFGWAEIRHADAVALPCEDASLDAAVAVQVYLFVADLDRAIGELARVLRPGARAVVVDTDWDSVVWHSGSRERMQAVMEVWMRRYVNARVARTFPAALRRAGLEIELATAIPIVELDPGEASYSGSQLPEVARYIADKGGVATEDARAWEDDVRALARRGEYFFSLNRYLFRARKPA
ncbi:MAG: methyltransferase domain-containing protein [Burkholderiales bacterium]|nr:methyltransferase domain-containing protein [Burkholderiales bacterium]